eukprot:NODE_1031_length_1046_cov_92.043526_g987_i0.p1 GENE.NODE_1031_length_1046_cov_92.043526_g987_i0~~NODE_1031_length_1046_cov_92.043526_g987_i0.p1  ORF type:complete len:265 (+),score=36.40 NODE_1031_length_1046_cov_92.043526_g987_i0:150-944(+)
MLRRNMMIECGSSINNATLQKLGLAGANEQMYTSISAVDELEGFNALNLKALKTELATRIHCAFTEERMHQHTVKRREDLAALRKRKRHQQELRDTRVMWLRRRQCRDNDAKNQAILRSLDHHTDNWNQAMAARSQFARDKRQKGAEVAKRNKLARLENAHKTLGELQYRIFKPSPLAEEILPTLTAAGSPAHAHNTGHHAKVKQALAEYRQEDESEWGRSPAEEEQESPTLEPEIIGEPSLPTTTIGQAELVLPAIGQPTSLL